MLNFCKLFCLASANSRLLVLGEDCVANGDTTMVVVAIFASARHVDLRKNIKIIISPWMIKVQAS